jgi:hypothetical protein
MSARVKTGFHRLGVIGLVPLGIVAGCCFAFAAYTMFSTDGVSWRDVYDPTMAGIAFLVLSWTWYGICWALGWVIAGFMGDGKQDAKP